VIAAVALMIAASLAIAFAQLAFKRFVKPRTLVMVLLGILLYGVSLNLTIAAYRLGALTALGPLASLAVIWTILLAVRFLGEVMTPLRWLGAGLIVVGSVVITT